MANVTLVLCRTPLQEFHFGHRSGRWGAMVMVEGPKVFGVLAGVVAQTAATAGVTAIKAVTAAMSPFGLAGAAPGLESLSLGGQMYSLVTDCSAVSKISEFDLMRHLQNCWHTAAIRRILSAAWCFI